MNLNQQQLAQAMAEHMLQGFNRHYQIFTAQNQKAGLFFAEQRFQEAAQEAREQVDFYECRVQECLDSFTQHFNYQPFNDALWRNTKLCYMTLLYEHLQPELAESFYNSMFCRLFPRQYYKNSYMFINSAINTEDIEVDIPQYRCYYPYLNGWQAEVTRMLQELPIRLEFEDLTNDVQSVVKRIEQLLEQNQLTLSVNTQVHVCTPLFYRNKGAYIVARIVDTPRTLALVLALLIRNARLYIDAVITEPADLSNLFSFTRAYLKVSYPIPSAIIRFLRSIVPWKKEAELYTIIGLHKQGKNEFYRDFLFHLRHSSDSFQAAQGIEGMVMYVFTLPSFPYVFKLIKDKFHVNKNINSHNVVERYHFVKRMDRVGRMADTWEFSHVAFPVKRFSPQCLQQLQEKCATKIDIEGDIIYLRHVYIERRMMPLNLYLETASDTEKQEIIKEYGNAIVEIAKAGIFPGDLLVKNFGVTRHKRVVFYDYDEIMPIEECNFRTIPEAQTLEQELASEPWYSVGANDIFPEEFGLYLITDTQLRQVFCRTHPYLMQSQWWNQVKQDRIKGVLPDIYPYRAQARL